MRKLLFILIPSVLLVSACGDSSNSTKLSKVGPITATRPLVEDRSDFKIPASSEKWYYINTQNYGINVKAESEISKVVLSGANGSKSVLLHSAIVPVKPEALNVVTVEPASGSTDKKAAKAPVTIPTGISREPCRLSGASAPCLKSGKDSTIETAVSVAQPSMLTPEITEPNFFSNTPQWASSGRMLAPGAYALIVEGAAPVANGKVQPWENIDVIYVSGDKEYKLTIPAVHMP